MSFGRTAFQIGFEVSPILLVQGLAANMPGNMLPILAITQAASFVNGLLSGTVSLNPDTYFARFQPLPGGTLISNQIGQYPFANQTVAANAIISQPLNISVEMICPARQAGDMIVRLATLSALKLALDNHIAQGGYFTYATPAFIYTNLILIGLRDITPGDSKQKQTVWQWDFQRPLITQAAAATATNSLMSKLNSFLPPGTPAGITPSWSGIQSAVGSSVSNALGAVVPSASNLIGSVTGTSNTPADFAEGP
jgi:hypothetical protein